MIECSSRFHVRLPPSCLLACSVTGLNYGASSISSAAQNDAAAAYRSLVQLAAASSTPIAPVMDSTRRYPGVYTCVPYCNLGGGVLTLDAQGVSTVALLRGRTTTTSY